jgi:arabinogalactan oligomer / maltooligosaccharide transport system substrate-binding protein
VSESSESAESRPPSTDPGGSPPSPQDPKKKKRKKKGNSPPPRQRRLPKWLPQVIVTFILVTVVGSLITAFVQHQNDQQQATEQQQAATLQTYINNMQGLLVDHSLATSTTSGTGGEVRQVARVQTLTTLRSLDDAADNKIVLQFLQDAHLIGGMQAVINLSNADLSQDDLAGANLSGIDLNGATLTGAQLSGANLSNASLSGANLTSADLDGTQLRGGTLTDAVLKNANMNGATMTDAVLTGADLGGADLNAATLIGADLASANLTGADLSGANLNDAHLLNSYSTQQQLNTVESCTNAIVSPLVCNHVPKIKLTYWYTESAYEATEINKLIGRFNSTNTQNIYINAEYKPFADWESGFATAGLENGPPDVLRVALGWVDEFASQGALLNLEPYMTQIQSGLSDYPGSPLGTTRGLAYDYYQGNLYGVPQVTDFLALLYNKKELQEAGINSPPATMADFEADTMKIVQNKAKDKATYGFETNGTSYDALPFIYAFGGGMTDKNNHIVVTSPGSVAGLTFLLNLQNHDKVMPPPDFSEESASSQMVRDFMTGKTAMIFDGPYDVAQILKSPSFRKDHGNLGIAPIPACPSSYDPIWQELMTTPTCQAGYTGSPLGGQSYAISAATDYPAEAASFISFMSQQNNQLAIAENNDTLPPLVSSADAKRQLPSNQVISAFLSIANTAVAPPTFLQAGQLSDAFDQNIADALDGLKSPSLALHLVAEAWRPLVPGS